MSPDGWSALANWVMASAAVAAAFAAVRGLRSWQEQLGWQADHELARKTLVLLYKLRDAVEAARHPAIWSQETEVATVGVELPQSDDQRRFVETGKVYERRWEKIGEVRAELYPLFLEGDAVWGADYRALRTSLWSLEVELKIVIQNYLRQINPNLGQETREAAFRIGKKKRDIMYDTLDESDEFRRDYKAALTPLEDALRLRLGRKNNHPSSFSA